MRTLYLDCFAGIAGDMLLGALIDLGATAEAVRDGLSGLPVRGWDLHVERVTRHGISATHVTVTADRAAEGSNRLSYPELANAIKEGGLPPRNTERALKALRALAEAEARVHGVPVSEVHFHEVGGVDTLVDIAGVEIALEVLGIARVMCSPIPLSHGFVECAHGKLPVPPPAVMELLKGVSVRPLDIEGETVTPTGAALAVTLAESFGPPPAMVVESVGYGAGTSEWPALPNVLRVFLGETQSETATEAVEVILLEANIDDMPAEHLAFAMERCFEAGALDVWFTPVQMKKNRPATIMTVLAEPEAGPRLAEVMFRNTTTFGIRQTRMSRMCLPRGHQTVETPYGPVRVKVATLPDGREIASPEYEDCAEAAKRAAVAIRDVYAQALAKYQARTHSP